MVAFLIGCVVLLLVVGCAGTSSDASKEQQGHTEATTKQDQPRSPEATESEEARCEGTRTHHLYFVAYRNGQVSKVRSGSEEDMKKAEKKAGQTSYGFGVYTTNDVPGCANGGLLSGTDGPDKLDGGDGDDEIRGLGEKDSLSGGDGNDVIYGGPGDDSFLSNGKGADVTYGGDGDDEIQYGEGKDVIYGGDGSDLLDGSLDHRQRDELYCGKGKDKYLADKNDYVDSSCEKKTPIAMPVD